MIFHAHRDLSIDKYLITLKRKENDGNLTTVAIESSFPWTEREYFVVEAEMNLTPGAKLMNSLCTTSVPQFVRYSKAILLVQGSS